jgi:hypothetical protein
MLNLPDMKANLVLPMAFDVATREDFRKSKNNQWQLQGKIAGA